MKRLSYKLLSLALFMGVFAMNTNGQCLPRSSYYWGEMLPNAGCDVFASYSPFGPGEYFRMPVLEGGSYTISTCGSTIDTQITGFQGTTTATHIFYNDDFGPDCATTQASITFTPNFTDYVRPSVTQYNCLPGGSASITVKVRQNNNLTFTSVGTDMCAGEIRSLSATPAAVVAVPQPGSGDVGSFSGTGVAGTTFTAPTPVGASQIYTVTYAFGYCTTTQDITVYRDPSTSYAGTDQTLCDTVATLAGNVPTYGTGVWSVVSGPGVVTTPSDPLSTVTGLSSATPTVLRWTITNGPCTTSEDDVTITTDPMPSLADAGPDQMAVCGTSANMAAAIPAVGNGTWTVVSGTGVPSSPGSPNSAVTGLSAGSTTTLVWTVSSGTCPATADTVELSMETDAPVPAVATLTDATGTCSVTPSAPTANDACTGVISGVPDVSLPITTIGTTVVTWTYDDGNGNTSTQTQNVIVNGVDATVTQAGATLTANTTGASYQWLNCDSSYAVITGATYQSYTPTWVTGYYAVEVSESGCVDTSACFLVDFTGMDELLSSGDITIYPNPSTGAFNVKFGSVLEGTIQLEIVDAQGRIVYNKAVEVTTENFTTKVDITSAESGVYFLSIVSEAGVLSSQRLIKE